jgi:dTDP-4-dehydrorhamnose reductase
MINIFVVGSSGLLGKQIKKEISKHKDLNFIGSDISDKRGIDITDYNSIESFCNNKNIDVIINCAAFTNVDACEEPEGYNIAKKVNADGVDNLAKFAKSNSIKLVHISSDYVFGDNNKDGYAEDYQTFVPLNKYAETKFMAEQNIINLMGGLNGSDFNDQSVLMYIVRTSWLFGQGTTNFISKIIELSKTHTSLNVVTDEISAPTYIKDLAERIIYILKNNYKGGIYHVAGNGMCSRFDFAKLIIDAIGKNTEILPSTLDKYPRKAKIANISYLINTKLPAMRSWQEMTRDYIANEL